RRRGGARRPAPPGRAPGGRPVAGRRRRRQGAVRGPVHAGRGVGAGRGPIPVIHRSSGLRSGQRDPPEGDATRWRDRGGVRMTDGQIDEGFLRRYRELLDAEDAAFDELEHAYEEGDRAHYEQDLVQWRALVERRTAFLDKHELLDAAGATA